MSKPPTFNPFDRSWWANPYPLYRRLLDEMPVGNVGNMPLYYFTRYRDCEQILRSSSFGVDERKSTFYEMLGPEISVRPDEFRSFLFLDPPDHTRIRSVVSRSFATPFVESMRPWIEQTADRLLDGIIGSTGADLVQALAYPLPMTVICELLAIPGADRAQFSAWSRHLVASLDPELFVEQEVLDIRFAALGELREYMRGIIASRRKSPGDDLVSRFLAAIDTVGGPTRLSAEELISTLVLLLVAGYETTANLLANGLLLFGRIPAVFERLRAEPTLLPAAVEEILRFDPPVQLTSRVALADAEFDGVTVPAGSIVIVLLAAANRDSAQFERPDEFDAERQRPRHLSFSLGAHHCVGASLARVEAESVFSAVLRRCEQVALIDEPDYRETIVLRGIEHLSARLVPAA